MQAVAIVRRLAGGAKTGHAGTLDPLATGVLVLAIGRATKIIDCLMRTSKRYRTTIDLSAFSTTDDLEGELTPIDVADIPRPAAIDAAVARFRGEILQRPPAFSAMKVGGRRAYQLARRGETVDIPERRVTIHSIDVVRYEWPALELDVHCGKGTYIRSLARDIGRTLGTGGHCASIRRTAVGPFDESIAMSLDDVPEPLTEDHLIPVDRALAMVEDSP